jgi:hypothetical protein
MRIEEIRIHDFAFYLFKLFFLNLLEFALCVKYTLLLNSV